MKVLLKRFFAQQSGATAVEYALMAAMITVVLVAAFGPLTTALTGVLQTVANAFPQTLPSQ
ncbi:MAG: Flp family type IVb pilin [Phenylobacterium sp.]|uniref:Flp family type IVb pilin n=1 Tax=Phenylobacterium sp. TaxID=1871053 RepID=UPI0025EEDC61|nr:Flp family type IVb pilin [Phenylobacterium sp.]MBA4013560.1 Flp family type IVb pilin [Phenylobacterium sp.]